MYGNFGVSLAGVVASSLPAIRTANSIRVLGIGEIAPVTYSVSVANVGAADGLFLGVALKVGETISFDAGVLNNTYAGNTFFYDATGTEFLIVYNQ